MNYFQEIVSFLNSREPGRLIKSQEVVYHLSQKAPLCSQTYMDLVLRMFRATGFLNKTSIGGLYMITSKSLEGITLRKLKDLYTEVLNLQR